MTRMRRLADIDFDLATAQRYKDAYVDRATKNSLVVLQRQENDREIATLLAERTAATTAELEVSLEGQAVEGHVVTVPYFQRVLEQLQGAFRTLRRAALAPGERLSRTEGALRLAGTGPGSFRAYFDLPTTQLVLGQLPRGDLALRDLLQLFEAAGQPHDTQTIATWAETADEPALRAVIKLAATLASSGGTTAFRLTMADQVEHLVSVAPDQARNLAIALAGPMGREVLSVTGHLAMAQDDPPRIRVETSDDEHLADVPLDNEELLERVKALLFSEVQATLVVDMRTSVSSGRPSQRTELLDVRQA